MPSGKKDRAMKAISSPLIFRINGRVDGRALPRGIRQAMNAANLEERLGIGLLAFGIHKF